MAIANPMGVKDREVLKKIDRSAMRSSMIEVLGYVVVTSWVLVPGGFYNNAPLVAVVCGALIVLTCLLRVAVNLGFDSVYGGGPFRWRRLFFFLSYLQAVGWTAFSLALFYYDGLSANTFSVWLLSGGICSATIVHISAYYYENRILVSIYILPIILALIVNREPQSLFLATGFLVFYIFLVRQAAYLFATLWSRIETQRQLRKKIIDLENAKYNEDESALVKQQFLQTITHEIRTPMNNILGMLSMLEDSELTKTQREYQSVAMSASESLLALIDDILDFSRISSGDVYLDKHFFNVRHAIKDCVEMLGPIAHEKGLELIYVCEPHIPLRVKGDSKRLKQVLVNFVTNAIQYSEEGEVVVEVFMSFPKPGNGILRVQVRDEGPGLALRDQEKAFDAFSTLSHDDSGGTGLGLAICRGLVTSMGGEIGVFSKEGKGSTFWFTAPVKISTQQLEKVRPHQAMKGKRVLAVGVTKGMDRFLSVELKEWGIELDTCDYTKAKPAVFLPDESPALFGSGYDLVILNMKLGSFDCLELSKGIAESPRCGEVPQVILTSLAQRGMVETLEHGRNCRQVYFLTKPAFRKSLYDCLHSVWDIEQENKYSVSKFPDKQSREANYTVLLVEDNKVNQMVAKGMITKLGHQVLAVSNGVEALGMLEDRYFDLILMDCIMPVMDGYLTTKEIRTREFGNNRHIPIVAMTANTFEGEEQKCLAAGMDDYLAKPVSATALAAKLRRWLGEDVTRAAIINTNSRNSEAESDSKGKSGVGDG